MRAKQEKDQGNVRKTIWMYAVILFTSAFIVLLLTAYSQIKFNKNIDQYQSQISQETQAKKTFQVNFFDALDINKSLTEQLKTSKEELDKVNGQLQEEKKVSADLQRKNQTMENLYGELIKADNEYQKGNYVASAEILMNIAEAQITNEEAKILYQSLVSKTYGKAALKYYNEGYTSYTKKDYTAAISKLKLAQYMAPKDYFADDSYYYIINSAIKQENYTEARTYSDKLISEYPQSGFIKDVKYLMTKYGY